MPTVASWVATFPERRARRIVWSTFALLLVVAACWYAKKASDGNSAFVRWREQVRMFWFDGVNIWDKQMFPNPPIVPISMLPLMLLPTVVGGAMLWFLLKTALAALSARACFRMVGWASSGRTFSPWGEGVVLLLSLRPILSDLHHGNNNLIILALIVATLSAWRKGYDVLAGLALGLAITYKVTPALFVIYFAYRQSWRTVVSTCLGVGIFLLIAPSLVIGPAFNGVCLHMWWHRILSPFVAGHEMSGQEINQSMVGVLARLLTKPVGRTDRYGMIFADRYVLTMAPGTVALIAKGISVGMLGLLAFLCRTQIRRRDDPRLLGEFSLVVLTMLIVSERSWKHHFVTVLLPYTYLVWQVLKLPRFSSKRLTLVGSLLASAFLMASTSSEVGGVLGGSQGHKLAQFYGMFLWAGVVLYGATAWRVMAERREVIEPAPDSIPAPHLSAQSLRAISAQSLRIIEG